MHPACTEVIAMKASLVKTEIGNTILHTLVKSEGWRIQAEYDANAFDKGIDFDQYTLQKKGAVLHFEWTNWLEWEITGDSKTLLELAQAYGFKISSD